MELIVLMTTYHRPNDSLSSIMSVLTHTPELHTLHILDNSCGGIDNTLELINDSRVSIHRSPTNIGKSRIVSERYNDAIKNCPLDHFIGMDGDIVVRDGWYTTLLSCAREVAPWAALAPTIVEPGDATPRLHVSGKNTKKVKPGIWYNQNTAGGLLLIRRKFWENWGGYPGTQLYGNDDGALCKEAIRRNQFIGYTTKVVVEHYNSDSNGGYTDWKLKNVTGLDNPGYWG